MTCYNAQPRPDLSMKEQLAEMTGLKYKVIRVWFQNQRCKVCNVCTGLSTTTLNIPCYYIMVKNVVFKWNILQGV